MSDAKLKRISDVPARVVVSSTKPRRNDDTGKYVPWRTTSPRKDESVRWECVDGRWVTISLGQDDHAGEALVSNSDGRAEYVDSFEVALDLAKRWRTVT